MNFKNWLEIVELSKPTSKIQKKTIIADRGTNVARPVIQYQWNTKLGNNIKLKMEPTGDSYYVIFYVNDVLYDFSSKKEGHVRDPEILGSVFYTLKLKANQLKAQRLTFRAHKGEGDKDRVIKGLNPEQYKPIIFNLIEQLRKEILQNEPEWAPPDDKIISLYQKIKRQVPTAIQHKSIVLLNNIIQRINNNEEIDDLIYSLELKFNQHPLIQKLREYNNAVKSNSVSGLIVRRNRRKNIYSRVLEREFSNNWNISVSDDYFELTRKL